MLYNLLIGAFTLNIQPILARATKPKKFGKFFITLMESLLELISNKSNNTLNESPKVCNLSMTTCE